MLLLRYILLLAFSAIFLPACKKESTDPPVSGWPGSSISAQKTLLALGDSYTIGQSVSITERFPAQTKQWLASEGIQLEDPTYIAATGWTTYDLCAAISNVSGSYSVVTLLIGVNDQYQRHDTTGYRERFSALLNTAITLAGRSRNHVFVLSIPDYSVTPASDLSDTAFIRKQVEMFNKINREVTAQYYCNYLDITPSTREALYDCSLITADSLHPSGKEYAKWAASLGAMMKPVLQ